MADLEERADGLWPQFDLLEVVLWGAATRVLLGLSESNCMVFEPLPLNE